LLQGFKFIIIININRGGEGSGKRPESQDRTTWDPACGSHSCPEWDSRDEAWAKSKGLLEKGARQEHISDWQPGMALNFSWRSAGTLSLMGILIWSRYQAVSMHFFDSKIWITLEMP